jgi:hypothetical protein
MQGSRKRDVSMVLAEQVLSLFEQSGTTPKEQNTALDIVRTIVLDRLYEPTVCAQDPRMNNPIG